MTDLFDELMTRTKSFTEQAESLGSQRSDAGTLERPKVVGGVPYLNPIDVHSASEMAGLYILLHMFENSVRHFIETTMKRVHGTDWWAKTSTKDMRTKLEGRKKQEKENKWITRRGQSPLYYLDFGHLAKIIVVNHEDFKCIVPDLRFLHRFDDVEKVRNIVAHHGVLPSERDFARVKLAFEDWCDLVRE